jgi:hypothetical protein
MIASLPACPPSHSNLLREAAAVLASVKEDPAAWDRLTPLMLGIEREKPDCWPDLCTAALEAMLRGHAVEVLGQDPWTELAPLITALLRRLPRYPLDEPRRTLHAVCRLLEELAQADPLTLPDGLPDAVAGLATSFPDHRDRLLLAFHRMADATCMAEMLRCGRTRRKELISLWRVAVGTPLQADIGVALSHRR